MMTAVSTMFWPILGCAALIAIAGLYSVMLTGNLIRALIGVEITIKAATLLIILGGYVTGNMGLAQALVITLIVVEVVLMVAANGIVLRIFRNDVSISTTTVSRLKG